MAARRTPRPAPARPLPERRPALVAVAGALTALSALLILAACGDDGVVTPAAGASGAAGTGTLNVLLTDAPFPFDSVKSVDVFVVRVDAKQAASDSADAAAGTADADRERGGWTTLAEPKARFDLLTLRDGKTALLGAKPLAAGAWRSIRLIIDPAQSGVTLKGGQAVEVHWPGAARSGIKVQLAQPVSVGKDSTKAVVLDFDVAESFVMRGNAMRNGFLFKPVVKATTR